MFIGEHRHSADDKGRVIIPQRFRDGLGDSFVLTCGLERCLVAFPSDAWNKYAEELSKLSFNKSDARSYIRLVFSKATEVTLDKQGRITVPQNLREYADIDKEIVLNGVLDRVELWSSDSWSEYSQEAEETYAEKAERLSPL